MSNPAILTIIIALVSFFLGSIPFGLIISKYIYHVDIREHGSGNIGTTNALRTMGKRGGAAVFLLDFGKGLLSGLIAAHLAAPLAAQPLVGWYQPTYSDMLALAFMGCTLGHIYSPWLKFKGGKGIAVAIGCLFITFGAPMACCELLVFALIVFGTKHVSQGSIAAAIACPFFAVSVFWPDWTAVLLCTIAAGSVVWAHRENIKRLREGTERRIGEDK